MHRFLIPVKTAVLLATPPTEPDGLLRHLRWFDLPKVGLSFKALALVLMGLGLGGCWQGWDDTHRFRVGSDFVDAEGRVIGRVVNFDRGHDFANGAGSQSAVEVELSVPVPGLATRFWCACETLNVGNYRVQPHRDDQR